ncbi:MAG: hypothetical protein WEF53_07165 [Bacteroidota bacterium]
MPYRRVDLHPPKPADFETAVESLLRPPYSEFIETLRSEVLQDSQYLFFHESSIGIKIQSMLIRSGINWDSKTMAFYWARVLRVALDRMEPTDLDPDSTD